MPDIKFKSIQSNTLDITHKIRRHQIISSNTYPKARIRLSIQDFHWADEILILKEVHRIKNKNMIDSRSIIEMIEVLGIQDNYTYMENELNEI